MPPAHPQFASPAFRPQAYPSCEELVGSLRQILLSVACAQRNRLRLSLLAGPAGNEGLVFIVADSVNRTDDLDRPSRSRILFLSRLTERKISSPRMKSPAASGAAGMIDRPCNLSSGN